MSIFHFKQFDVANERSSMKVNTDGVLLGAAVTLSASDRRVLDVGTGTGTIALMLAQRYQGPRPAIVGIDIDAPSAEEAEANFRASRWAESLEARHCALRDFVPDEPLDLIVSNPPYYDDSLLPPEARRGLARHTAGPALSFADLADFARTHLRRTSAIPVSPANDGEPASFVNASVICQNGRLAVILPADQERAVRRYAVSCGLYPFRILRIRTTPRKAVSRLILEFGLQPCDAISDTTLTIQDPASAHQDETKASSGDTSRITTKNGYTPEYIALTGDFYL